MWFIYKLLVQVKGRSNWMVTQKVGIHYLTFSEGALGYLM